MLQSLSGMWPVIQALTHVTEWIVFGVALTVGAAAVGYFFPFLRQTALAAVVLFLAGTVIYSKGVYDERLVCLAKQELADREGAQRDQNQGTSASADESERNSALQAVVDQQQRDLDDYKAQLAARKDAPCDLSPSDLPQRR